MKVLSLLLCLLTLYCTPLFAKRTPIKLPPKASLERMIQEASLKALIGIRVEDAKTGALMFAHNDLRLFTPASTTKLLTAAASLHSLGPQFSYRTQLFSDTPPQNGHLNHLFVHLSGDPSLKTNDLTRLARELAEQGVRTITQGIVLDMSRFEGSSWAPGWTVDGLNWYYHPPISAAILDENTVQIIIDPEKKLGVPLKARYQDKSIQFPIHGNIAAVSSKGSKFWCELLLEFRKENTLEVGGCWPRQKHASTLNIALRDPVHYFQFRLRQALQKAGIQVFGGYRVAKMPLKSFYLAEHRSKTLPHLLKPLLEDSNNLYAESLLKTIGWQEHRVGSFQGGVNALKEIIQDNLAVDLQSIRLKDGSGGSHYNLVSPKHLTDLLRAMKKSIYSKEFYNALPRSGYTGTLKFRLSDPPNRGRFRAKTGTLTGSTSLAGILKTKKGHDLVFAVMIDQTTLSGRQARLLIDTICQRFVDL